METEGLKRKNEAPPSSLFDERIDKKKKLEPAFDLPVVKKPQRPKQVEDLPITKAIKNCVNKYTFFRVLFALGNIL